MNTYQVAKKMLSEEESKRAKMLVKIKNAQAETDLLRADMVNCDAKGTAVTKYNGCKQQVDAFKAVLDDIDKVRIPAARAKVSHEKVAISTIAQLHCAKQKDLAIVAIQKKFNEVFKLMHVHEAEVVAYLKEQGNPPIPSRIGRISINDMSREIRRQLI